MKIKLLKIMAGPEGCFGPGDVLEVSGEEGRCLIESGSAVALSEVIVETSEDVGEIETAEAPQARRRGRPAIGKGK